MLIKKKKLPDVSPRELGLKSKSFEAVTRTRVTPRVIANVEAEQKVGKTDFCIRHAPDPIVIFNFDQGLEGVVEKHRKRGKVIIVAGMPTDIDGQYPSYAFGRPIPQGLKRKSDEYLTRVKKEAYPMWEQWISDYDEFLHSKARTGIVDTGGGAYALGKFAYVGMDKYKPGTDDPYGQKTGDLKSIFQGLVTEAYNYDKNVLWIHRLKDKWGPSGPTGEHEIDGYKQLPYEVQLTLRLTKKIQSVGTGKNREKVTTRYAEVRESRIGAHLNGKLYSEDEFKFDVIMAEIFGTDVEEFRA